MFSIWSFDPGLHTGYCHVNWETGEVIEIGVVEYDNLHDFCEDKLVRDSGILSVICEDYIIRPGNRNIGTRGPAIAAETLIRHSAGAAGIRVVRQQPGDRLLGARFVEYKLPKGHTPDHISAYLHAVFYMRKRGKFVTPLEKRNPSWKDNK